MAKFNDKSEKSKKKIIVDKKCRHITGKYKYKGKANKTR